MFPSSPSNRKRHLDAVGMLRVGLSVCACLSGPAGAQDMVECTPLWDVQIGSIGAMNGNELATVSAIAQFNDGVQTCLYIGGNFTSVGGVPAAYIARWDGESWHDVGGGFANTGPGIGVRDMTVFDDGSGPKLIAVGNIATTASGVVVNGVARWNGQTWSAIGNGITSGPINTVAVYTDTTGPRLYVGGQFSYSVSRWTGSFWIPINTNDQWSAQGGADVFTLATINDGTGPSLYIGGRFQSAGGMSGVKNLLKWDGVTLTKPPQGGPGGGSGSSYGVHSIVQVADGPVGSFIIGGYFFHVGPVGGPIVNAHNLAMWNGNAWQAIGEDIYQELPSIVDLAYFNDGEGLALYAIGGYTNPSFPVVRFARRRDGQWSMLGNLWGHQSPIGLALLPVYSGLTTRELFVGGRFRFVNGPSGTITTKSIARRLGCVPTESCGTGFWKQPHHFDQWPAPYHPQMLFADAGFDDAFPGKSLLYVLADGGGGLKALGRQVVAALLNAASPQINSPIVSVDALVNEFNNVWPGTPDEYESLKATLEEFNGGECPLDDELTSDDQVAVQLNDLLSRWGACSGSGPCPWDLDGNGLVEVGDLIMLLAGRE